MNGKVQKQHKLLLGKHMGRGRPLLNQDVADSSLRGLKTCAVHHSARRFVATMEIHNAIMLVGISSKTCSTIHAY